MRKIAAVIFFCASLFIIITAFAVNKSSLNQKITSSEFIYALANPAAVYCTGKGYRYLIIKNTGICLFPDDSYCEEWAYFKGSCKPGDHRSISNNHPMKKIIKGHRRFV